ncbi:hypothetical protein [Krasilnikovia sp. MM14-A1259]
MTGSLGLECSTMGYARLITSLGQLTNALNQDRADRRAEPLPDSS